MSPSVHAVKRKTGAGLRWYVRYRVGGRGSRLQHAGTAHTIKERDALIDSVRDQLLAHGTYEPVAERPDPLLRDAGLEYLASRVDLAAGSLRTQRGLLEQVAAELGPATSLRGLEPGRVALWLQELHGKGRKRNTLRGRLNLLRAVLDHAGVDPNPARHPSVRLPHEPRVEIQPPTAAQFARLLQFVQVKHRLPCELLEATGMRVSELRSLAWRDVDLAGCRIRVTGGKTQAARRWLPVASALAAQLPEAPVPADGAAPVFPGFSDAALRMDMARACREAALPRFSPHDLRHRYISKLVQGGVPITTVRMLAGHSKASVTLDVYSHVLLED